MKHRIGLILACLLISLVLVNNASAAYYLFAPNPPALQSLPHNQFFTWGMRWSPKPGEIIKSATLSISCLRNYRPSSVDTLFINLLDNPSNLAIPEQGVRAFADTSGVSNKFDNWAGQHMLLDTYHDIDGNPENYQYLFKPADLAFLTAASKDSIWGLGFDPDCHFYNSGMQLLIETSRDCPVPEPATMALVAFGLLGGAGLRKKRSA